jgi:hypothetical protein
MSEKEKNAAATLAEDDIVSEKGREVGRRDAVGLLGAAAAVSAVALSTGCAIRRPARVVVVGQRTGITDRDGGPCADPAGGGRGVSGVTDADAGGCADPAGRGRGAVQQVVVQQPVGITDRDGGPCADPAGGGRGVSGTTDSDGGYCSDPAGRGRRGY